MISEVSWIRMETRKYLLRFVLISAVMILRAQPSPRQDAAQNAQISTAEIEGVVVDSVSGKPIPDVLVGGSIPDELRIQGIVSGAYTDANGHFLIGNLRPGQNGLYFVPPGYLEQTLSYFLTAGERLQVFVKLVAPGIITGKVVMPNGLGAPKVGVGAYFHAVSPLGASLLKSAKQTTTDDRGEFRLAGLRPGKYLISMAPAHLTACDDGSSVKDSRSAAMFYPGVSSISLADTVEVRNGEEVRLKPSTAGQSTFGALRIHLINRSDAKVVQVGLRYISPDLSNSLGFATALQSVRVEAGSDAQRTCWLGSIGLYQVAVRWNSSDGSLSELFIPFEFLGPEVLTEIVLEPSKGRLRIHGEIEERDGSKMPVKDLKVGLCRADASDCLSPFSIAQNPLPGDRSTLGANPATDSTGGVTLFPIAEGRYELAILNAPPGTYVAGVTQGGRNVLADGVDVSDRSASLEILLRRGEAKINGRVLDGSGQPIADANVVLLPAPPLDKSRFQALHRSIHSNSDGTFSFDGVIPGNYEVYSWKDHSINNFPTEAEIKELRHRSKAVQVDPESRQSFDLTPLDL